MLSMMNESSGASLSAFSISSCASGRRSIAVGKGIAERVVGVRVLGPYLDQLAQEASRMSTRSTFSASMA